MFDSTSSSYIDLRFDSSAALNDKLVSSRSSHAYSLHDSPPPKVDWSYSPWSFGLISRELAEDILEHGPSGAFLVRERLARRGEYCISVKNKDMIDHIRIVQSGSKYYLAEGFPFASIPDLIAHYEMHPLGDHFSSCPTKLVWWPTLEKEQDHSEMLSSRTSMLRLHQNDSPSFNPELKLRNGYINDSLLRRFSDMWGSFHETHAATTYSRDKPKRVRIRYERTDEV